MSLFDFFKKGLEKTATSIKRSITGIFTDTKAWDDETYSRL